MRIIVVGCVDFTLSMLSTLIENQSEIIGVVSDENSGLNSDFADLRPLCKDYDIPILLTSDVNSITSLAWISSLSPDVIFCLGWSRLIKRELLQIPAKGVIGYHPSALPENRGRHPLIWALVLGLKKTASTFFFLDEGADSGDIISQSLLEIREDDDAALLYKRMTALAREQIVALVEQVKLGSTVRISQDSSLVNVWRKRVIKDGEIDWRMNAKSIYNLVRGLTKPYIGAHFINDEIMYKVWKIKIIEYPGVDSTEPGKIIDVTNNGSLIVKCGQGCVALTDVVPSVPFQVGEYL